MSGAGSDLPDGFVPDGAPPSPGEDASGPTVEGILREAGYTAPQSRHEQMAAVLRPHMRPTGQAVASLDDPPEWVAGRVHAFTGRVLGSDPTWIRIVRPDLGRGVLLVLHAPHPDNEAELIVLADPGVLTRGVIVDACRWAFFGLGLCRVVVRIPADRPDLSDLARRARFQFEGTARRFYRGTLDAQVWAMVGPDCPWIRPREPKPAPVLDPPPPSSRKMH